MESAFGLSQGQGLNVSSYFTVTMWGDIGCVTWLLCEVGIIILI